MTPLGLRVGQVYQLTRCVMVYAVCYPAVRLQVGDRVEVVAVVGAMVRIKFGPYIGLVEKEAIR